MFKRYDEFEIVFSTLLKLMFVVFLTHSKCAGLNQRCDKSPVIRIL